MMLDSDDELQEWRQQKYPHRMDHWYVMDIFNKPFMCKIHFAGIIRRLIYWVPRKKMDMNLIYGGWNWFSLHRNVIGYLLDFWNDNPKYIARFKYTTSSDELIFSSILYPVADQLKIMKRNSLRYIDWHPKREYTSLPLILDERDFPDIKKSDAVFCRKVDLEHSEKLLNLLDGII